MNMLLKLSLDEQKPIDMIYQSNAGEITQRIIRVVADKGEYIKAYCFFRKKERLFKKNNILSVAPIQRRKRKGA